MGKIASCVRLLAPSKQGQCLNYINCRELDKSDGTIPTATLWVRFIITGKGSEEKGVNMTKSLHWPVQIDVSSDLRFRANRKMESG